ncbi:M48 family metallopeptidase [uncultured Clostridium sp.]|nr:M48 family metallopeptidase [uncultured Clostridium sp.]
MHKSEKKWFGILVFLNLAIIITVLVLCIINFKNYSINLPNTLKESFSDPSSYVNFIMSPNSALNNFPTELQILITGLIAIIAFPFGINLYYAKYRTRAIKITENNFPEVYYSISEYSNKLGIKTPEAFLIQQNGVMNAFSSFIIRKQYIEIDSDLFEIAYREYNDLESINFIIAHELAHIRYKHATFLYNLSILFSSLIPIISSTASRAREYSCDRLAQKVTGNNGVEAMFCLLAGKHLYKRINVYDYIESSKDIKGFFVWCNNLVSSHPILPKRIRALLKSKGSGELY